MFRRLMKFLRYFRSTTRVAGRRLPHGSLVLIKLAGCLNWGKVRRECRHESNRVLCKVLYHTHFVKTKLLVVEVVGSDKILPEEGDRSIIILDFVISWELVPDEDLPLYMGMKHHRGIEHLLKTA